MFITINQSSVLKPIEWELTIGCTNPALSCSARHLVQYFSQHVSNADSSLFILSSFYHHLQAGRQRVNTEIFCLLLNLTDFIIFSSSTSHLCWQFSICSSLAASHYQLIFLEWQHQQTQPILTDMWVTLEHFIWWSINLTHAHITPFLFLALFLILHFSHFIWLCTIKSESKRQVLERVVSEDLMSGFSCVLIWILEKESGYSTWILAVFTAHFYQQASSFSDNSSPKWVRATLNTCDVMCDFQCGMLQEMVI